MLPTSNSFYKKQALAAISLGLGESECFQNKINEEDVNHASSRALESLSPE